MTGGIPAAREIVRNLSQVRGTWSVLLESGPFRVVRFEKMIEGSELWIVNDKGFLWEPVATEDAALAWLDSDEARSDETADG